MKKTIIVSVVLAVACIFMGCKQNSSDAGYLDEYLLGSKHPNSNKYLEDYYSETDYDFIYEVVNNTSVSIDIAPVAYLGGMRIYAYHYNQPYSQQALLNSQYVRIAAGTSFQFKLRYEALRKDYGGSVSIGLSGRQSGDRTLYDYCGPDPYYGDFKMTARIKENGNTIEVITTKSVFGPELKTYESDYDCSFEIKNESDYSLNTQGLLLWTNGFIACTKDVIIPANSTYLFKLKLSDISSLIADESCEGIGLCCSIQLMSKLYSSWHYPSQSGYYLKTDNLEAYKGKVLFKSIVKAEDSNPNMSPEAIVTKDYELTFDE